MKKIVLFTAVLALVFTSSCVKNSSEYKELQARNDSLALANAQFQAEVDQIMSLFNEVEDNFRSIKQAENYLSVQSSTSGELTPSTRERIQSDMQFITETLNKNRERIADLENKLKNSNLKSSSLSKTLDNLRHELEQKTMALVSMKDELEQKDREIAELSANVTALASDVQMLRVQANQQQATIQQQQSELNTVYYCFGTTKELRAQKVMVGNQLGTDFDPNFFIPVRDFNTLRVIPLFAKKGQLVSKHPDGSYEFVKGNNGMELHILNPKNFWSLTRFLVVQVNV
jgi:archaellum component FlaC